MKVRARKSESKAGVLCSEGRTTFAAPIKKPCFAKYPLKGGGAVWQAGIALKVAVRPLWVLSRVLNDVAVVARCMKAWTARSCIGACCGAFNDVIEGALNIIDMFCVYPV